MGSKLRSPAFNAQLCHFLNMGLWTRNLASSTLSPPLGKRLIIVLTSQVCRPSEGLTAPGPAGAPSTGVDTQAGEVS